MTAGSPEIIVVENADALAESAAARLVARIAAKDGKVSICLTGGSSPKALYRLLATPPWRGRIAWPRIHWFMGDERFVPVDHADSNGRMARQEFLDACAPSANVHMIATDCADPDAAAYRYETTLRAVLAQRDPLFDLVLMGIGPDGHTASLFPGAAALSERERFVVGVPPAPVAPHVARVTLALPVLASCHEMLFLISGADKRGIVARVLAEPDLPAAQARSREYTVWLMDRAAAPEAG